MKKIAMLVLAFALMATAFAGCRAMEPESTGASTTKATQSTASTTASTAPSTAPSSASTAPGSTEPEGSITPRGPRMPHY